MSCGANHKVEVHLKAARLRQEYPKTVSSILVAVEFGLTRLIDKILKLGNSIEGKGSDRWAALHWATWGGHEAIVQLLLQKGAYIEAKENDGWTTLHGAAENGHKATVQLLLEKGQTLGLRTCLK